MKILVSTTARLSHLRALLPFVTASVEGGHHVALAAPRSLAEYVTRFGLRHLAFDDVSNDEFRIIRDTERFGPETHAPSALRLLAAQSARAALPGLRAVVEEFRPDLIVRDVAELASLIVAQSYGIPEVPVQTTCTGSNCQILWVGVLLA
ncbi:hypothetical protein ABZU32_40565 [Sphaerisporangium sp. NPDC005288]|uniref:hypothetical protein n=1 Tax=Sphaerisporangium sp. NPDC005288 TaxID=3155114 RepID=UPI0033B62B02